jgi:hypothetical protein
MNDPYVSAAVRARREQARVKALIARDKADRMKEIERAAAEIKVREGLVVTAHETVMEPTPEWFQHGDAEAFTPELPDGTVRELKTVRRVRVPIVARLNTRGHIDADELKACLWYRMVHEHAGLQGRYSISRYQNTPPSGAVSSRQAGFAGHIPMTEYEAQARRYFREARQAITPHYLAFFDKVVLHDTPITRASRFVRARNGKALKILLNEVRALARYCDTQEISRGIVDRS